MVSIVIPAYNEEDLIGQCIDSIHRELHSFGPYEIIVVNNGSTDNTVTIAKERGCIVIDEPDKGVTRARQAGFEVARSSIVAFIDADNIIPQGWLWFMLEAISPIDVAAVSGPVIYYDFPLHKRIITSAFYTVAKLSHLFFPMLQGGNFVVKREALLQAGGFATDVDFYGEDTATAMRLSKVGTVVFDLNMFAYSSARRMEHEGLLLTGSRYIMNYFWMWIFKRPFTAQYNDIRPK